MSPSTPTKLTLTVTKREILGKKLSSLRREGLLPANIFGKDIASQSVSMSLKEFQRIFKKAGETQVVYLTLDTQEIPVLIQNIHRHPVTHALLHSDLRKVDLTQKLDTHVPVKLVGTSDAVTQNKGVLLTMNTELLVEAYPDKIPSLIEVDIASLKELNDQITVKDLTTNAEYVFKDDPKKIIVRITEHKEESVETQVVAPETVEVTTEKKDEIVESETETPPKTPPKAEVKKEEKK